VRVATGLDEVFDAADKMDRERFVQLMSTQIQPAIKGLEVHNVELGTGRHALVLEVPRARGRAYQTPDRLFWRRDAQGRRKMTAQEIEDVRALLSEDARFNSQDGRLCANMFGKYELTPMHTRTARVTHVPHEPAINILCQGNAGAHHML